MTQGAHTSLPEVPVPDDVIPPLPLPPIHPVTAILSRRKARPLGSPRTPYDASSVELQTLYRTFSCRLWADKLHFLSLEGDQVIAIAQAKYCPALTRTASGRRLMWPYDDGTVTSNGSTCNSLISSITGPHYPRMNQAEHCVYTVIQPVQLM